ncbi:MAG: methionine--tRNA ligase subunit beta, partial [Solobacterium sp.]|nr:methionine--tRNA ligase subunit beta [Solobacterium sp.]
ILNQLQTQQCDFDTLDEFGKLETEEHRVTNAPEILFKRLDEKEVMTKVEAIEKEQRARFLAQKKKEEKKEEIAIGDFQKIELRNGVVLKCERHPDAEKLLVLQVDLGDGETRQIVSGIAASYTPGQMIGKNIILVTNLKPTKIRGVESQGMLLAGQNGNELIVAEVNGLKPGTTIS